MYAQGNGQPPGYQAPSFTSMQDDQLVAYVPRRILGIIVLFCVGLGVLTHSSGVLGVYILLHGLAAYLTYRDPRWFHVLVESLRFRWRVYRLRFSSASWRRHQRVLVGGAVLGVVLIYVMALWIG